MEKGKENIQDNRAPSPHSTSRERLTGVQVQRRVDDCILLRYKADQPILQREWLDYCDKTYGDKSKPQYLNYWMAAKEQYEEGWRGQLEKLLEPAMESLRENLNSDNPYTKAKAIDQIWKMSGNDIQKHHVLTQEIKIGFDTE